MLEVLKSSPGDKLTYCLLVEDDGRLDVRCVKLKDVDRLIAVAKSANRACALEVHPNGRVESACGEGVKIAELLTRVRP